MPAPKPESQPLESNAVQDVVGRLIARWFSVRGGELFVDGMGIGEMARRFGTPLYVYSERALDERWRELKACLPETFEVCYSMKANPNQAFLRFFLARGCGIEIASGGELLQALRAGCPPPRIVFAGPGKTDAELEQAVGAGAGEIHVESVAEAARLNRIAQAAGRVVRVALRINPAESAQGGAMRMGGRPAPFGIDEEQLEDAASQVLALRSLDLAGLHMFTGTQILDAEVLLRQYRHAVRLAERLAAQMGRPLRTLDFGGGLGVRYFAHEEPLDTQALAAGLRELAWRIRNHPALTAARLLIEPGRFLVAEAGLYVARVVDVKDSRGKRFVVLDGGMHHHLAASGNLGQTIKRNYPIAVANRIGEEQREAVELVGPLCTPLDVLGRGVELPRLRPGDLIAVFQSGAYARTSSPLGFLSHPAPPEIWAADGDARLVRRRGEPKDALGDQPPFAGAPHGPE